MVRESVLMSNVRWQLSLEADGDDNVRAVLRDKKYDRRFDSDPEPAKTAARKLVAWVLLAGGLIEKDERECSRNP